MAVQHQQRREAQVHDMKHLMNSYERPGALVVLTVNEEHPLILSCLNMPRLVIPGYLGLVSRVPNRPQSLML